MIPIRMRNDYASPMQGFRFRFCLVLLVALVTGCSEEGERIVEDSLDRAYEVNPSVRLSLKNTDGSIRLYGANTRQIKIQAIKKAYGQERLDKIAVNISAQADVVSIDTVFPPKPKLGLSDRSGTVDYVIVVPENCTISRLELATGEILVEGLRGGKVSANLVNGRLFDHNCFGDHQLFVANGGLEIAFDWWEGERFSVAAKIVNGNMRAFIPGEAAFRLIADTDDGNIANDFNQREDRHRELVKNVDMSVGGGGMADFQLHATNGSIRVAEAYR